MRSVFRTLHPRTLFGEEPDSLTGRPAVSPHPSGLSRATLSASRRGGPTRHLLRSCRKTRQGLRESAIGNKVAALNRVPGRGGRESHNERRSV